MRLYLALKAQIASLLAKKVTVLDKYLDFAIIFLKKLAEILFSINQHNIKMVKNKKSLYELFYSLRLVK